MQAAQAATNYAPGLALGIELGRRALATALTNFGSLSDFKCASHSALLPLLGIPDSNVG
jgi:hypothetical protein